MRLDTLIHRYNLLNFLGKLGLQKASFYAEIHRRRHRGLMLNDSKMAVGISQSIDRFGRMV